VAHSAEEWYDSENDFDYIHTRITLGSFSDMRNQIIRQAFERLRPGGWLECQDLISAVDSDHAPPPGEVNAAKVWADEISEIAEHIERPLREAVHLKRWLEEAGFVNGKSERGGRETSKSLMWEIIVQERVYRIPLGGWPKNKMLKHIGELWYRNFANGLSAFSLALLHRFKGMSQEEIEVSQHSIKHIDFPPSSRG